MSFKMAAVITGGAYGGYRLDQWLQPGFPVFTLVLSLASVALAMYIVIVTTRN
ncbi:MAG: AtpZ/AtpI family protein [Bacteroidota bacterium]